MPDEKFEKLLCIVFVLMISEPIKCANSSENIDVGQKCEDLLLEYAIFSANFVQCFIQYARPITVCQECVQNYIKVRNSHSDIMKLKDEETGEACKLELINVDRLEVIEGNYEYVVGEWKRASCDKCFDNNSTELNSDTKEILDLQKKIKMCIDVTHQSSDCNSSSIVCTVCLNDYQRLNAFYDEHKSYEGFCMDIVDMMNVTRYNWSTALCCGTNRRNSEVLFVVVNCAICLIPVIFYFLIWSYSTSHS